MKGYQTKLLLPPVRFYCFKCAAIYLCVVLVFVPLFIPVFIYVLCWSLCLYLSLYLFMCCACLCVFIYPCIYLCYVTVYGYDMCIYGMHINIYSCVCFFVIYAIDACLTMRCFASFVDCYIFPKITK